MLLKAALHVHSTYSDGEMSIREVRDRLVADGCQVICMADHADTFDPAKLQEYGKECRSLSDSRVRLVPGLEFSCSARMHVVGYGVEQLTGSTDPEAVIEHIRSAAGVSVIAHPAPEHLPRITEFSILPDGIEVWNTKYDGASAPRPAMFELVRVLQARRPDLLAFYGLDLHWKNQFRDLHVELNVGGSGERAILDALRYGRFVAVARDWRLPADGRVDPELLAVVSARYSRSRRWRLLARSVKRWVGPLGRSLPGPVKSHLRRFL